MKLPDIAPIGAIDTSVAALPELGEQLVIGEITERVSPFEARADDLGENNERNAQVFNEVMEDQFKAIHEGRKQQQQAIELANDTEYWFAVYFQTREQKEHFLQAMKWIQHGDKYLDGRWIAKQHGVELPPRPSPYKVGRLDKSLKALT